MNSQQSYKPLNILTWVAQIVLAIVFFLSGILKTIQPMEKLKMIMPWTDEVSEGIVRFIGVAEILGTIGIIFPFLLHVKPRLTALAAAGLGLIMFLATFFHLSRNEFLNIPITVFLGFLAAFVAWRRFRGSQEFSKGNPRIRVSRNNHDKMIANQNELSDAL